MPELPEVETVRTVLYPYIVGEKILQVKVNLPKVIANLTPEEFNSKIVGQKIIEFSRRGKFLTLHLENSAKIVIHFRMTGTLTIENPTTIYEKHTNLVITLTNNQELRYIDSRGFGHFWYFDANQADTSGQELLGPEPSAITIEYLQKKIATKNTALKTLLLNQHIIAGIGNIYADEICFRANILPTRKGSSLTNHELQKLYQTIPAIINEFIKFHHVTFKEYSQSKGTSYQNDANLKVYGRANKPCLICKKTLTGTRIGQRSSVYCKNCQK
ncbi:MAG: DNA-formamidopyrimidine glycosylase [Clostridia bacterium]|nr:DNA-formamidopyrimidine glycosylase [Clostridia bacterium]